MLTETIVLGLIIVCGVLLWDNHELRGKVSALESHLGEVGSALVETGTLFQAIFEHFPVEQTAKINEIYQRIKGAKP